MAARKHKQSTPQEQAKPRVGEMWRYRGPSIPMRGMRGAVTKTGSTFVWLTLTVHPGSPGTLTWKSTLAAFLERWIRVEQST